MALQEDLIDALWGSQTFYAEAVDALWQAHMSRSTAKLGRARSNFSDATRATQRDALAFGKRTDLADLTESAIAEAYIIGKLFIAERDRQIRTLGKKSPAPDTLRVDVEKVKTSPAQTIVAGIDFTLVDEEAIKNLSAQSTIWFRDKTGAAYFNPAAVAAINETAKELVEQGKSASAVAAALQSKAEALYGVGEFAGKSRSYWGGVAEHAATSAGVAGQLSQMVSLGWNRYEIVNPMDERTTPICQHLNGKTVLVSAGVAEIAAVGAATTPGAVKAVKPFASGGSVAQVNKALGTSLSIGAQDLSPAQSVSLAQAGFSTPPYHFRCRSYIDISFSEGDTVPPLGPGLVPPGALKVPKTPGATALPPPKPKPLPLAPKPVTVLTEPPQPKPAPAPAQPPPPPPELPPGGFPFSLDEVKVVRMDLGGTNPKFAIEAPDGSRWMFKDYANPRINQPFRANVDALAARIQTAAGIETPETYILDLPKKWKGWGAGESPRNTSGSIARLFDADDVAAWDLKTLNLEDLGALAIEDAQIDHAVNWLMSNGDGHFENFILLKNGRLTGIDKAQGFKFFGKDTLKIDYVSPQAPSPSSNGFAYMESQLQRYAQGRGPQQMSAVRTEAGGLTDFGRRLQAIVDIPDEEYTAIIRPYLEDIHKNRVGMFGRTTFGGSGEFVGKSVDDAIEAVLARKNGLVAEVDDLYLSIERARARSLGKPLPTRGEPALDVVKPKKSPVEFHSPTRRGLKGQIDKSQLRGFYVMSGGFDLEDAGMHAFKVARKGGTGARAAQYQFRGRLLPAARVRIDALAKAKVTGTPAPGAPVGVVDELLKAKQRSTKIGENAISWVRSYNSRVDPFKPHTNFGQDVNTGSTIARYKALMEKLDDIIAGKPVTINNIADKSIGLGTFTPTELDIATARHYKKELAPYFDNAAGRLKTTRIFSDGFQVDEFDIASFKSTKKKPKAPPKPENTPKDAYTVTQGGENHLYTDNVWVSADGPVLQEEWGTAAARRNFETIGYKERDVASAYNGARSPIYEFRSTTNKKVSLRYVSDTTSGNLFKGDVRLVIDKANPTAQDFKDGWQLMRDVGIDMRDEAPAIDDLKVLWARKQANATGAGYDAQHRRLFNDISGSLPAKEQLEKLGEAFDDLARTTGQDKLKWSELTKGMKDKDFLPVFTQDSTTGGRKAQAHGFPQWVRRDVSEKGFQKAGVHGSFSSITGNGAVDLARVMAGADNVSMISTSTRMAQGIYPLTSMSPVADIGTGGAQYVFTRLRQGSHSYGRLSTDKLEKSISKGGVSWTKNGTKTKVKFDPDTDSVNTDPGLYFNRKSLTYTDNLYYSHDKYGDVSSADFISRNMAKTFSQTDGEKAIKTHMSGDSTNEMIVRNSLGMQQHLQFWVVANQSERRQIIEAFKDAGITKFGKKKVEDVVVVRSFEGFDVN